jgi:NADH-quinone oxidoreductase subunit B
MGLIVDRLPGMVQGVPGGSIVVTSVDTLFNWSRANSLWPLAFGTKCCAIEMLMATGAPHQDLARFGAEVARQSPRQADLMVVAGAIVKKMAPRLRMLYEQMAEPRYVIATGSCAISGGPFLYGSYTIVRGVDEVVPVDVYVPGCPPRPEAFFWGLLTLQKLIRQGTSIRQPGIRRKPVMAALPQGVSERDISEETRKLLEDAGVVDVEHEAGEKIWAERIVEWMAKHSYRP